MDRGTSRRCPSRFARCCTGSSPSSAEFYAAPLNAQKHYLTAERPNLDSWACVLLTAADEAADAFPPDDEPEDQTIALRGALNGIMNQARLPECALSSVRRQSARASAHPPVAAKSDPNLLQLFSDYVRLYSDLVDRCQRTSEPKEAAACALRPRSDGADASDEQAVLATDRAAIEVLRADVAAPLALYTTFLAEIGGVKRPLTPLAFARHWGAYCVRSMRPDLTSSDRTVIYGVFQVMRGIRVAVLRILHGADDAPECKLAEQRIDAVLLPPTPPATPELGHAPAQRAVAVAVEAPALDLPPLSDTAPLPLDDAVRAALADLVSAVLPMFD